MMTRKGGERGWLVERKTRSVSAASRGLELNQSLGERFDLFRDLGDFEEDPSQRSHFPHLWTRNPVRRFSMMVRIRNVICCFPRRRGRLDDDARIIFDRLVPMVNVGCGRIDHFALETAS